MQSVDVAIVGGGMVGLAVACGLQGSGLRRLEYCRKYYRFCSVAGAFGTAYDRSGQR